MKNFERLNKNEMKMVLGGITPEIAGDGGSCSVSLKCSDSVNISCSGEPGTCVVSSGDGYVSCDGAKTYCN
jgi:hypothetical protein